MYLIEKSTEYFIRLYERYGAIINSMRMLLYVMTTIQKILLRSLNIHTQIH